MAQDTTYNGWTNYETWAVKLWLDDDEGTYRLMREITHDAMAEPNEYDWEKDDDHALRVISDRVKDYIEDQNPLNDSASVYTDLLNGAISEVNWWEIAQAMIDDERNG